jgi:hypothetical protein
MYALPEPTGDRSYGGAGSPPEITFDWIMAPIAGLSDAFFALLHIRLPDYAQRPPRPGEFAAGGARSSPPTPRGA